MNHIARLQNDLVSLRAELTAKSEALHAFRAHLASDKFVGFESHGSRKDWIAVHDVDAWLCQIIGLTGELA